jgi:hypothetical protein
MTREFHPSSRSLAWRLTRWVLVAGFAIVGPGAVSAHAADATFTLDFGNAYIWRGIVLNDNGVAQFGLDAQPLDAWGVPIGFNVWGNYDIGAIDDSGMEGTEISELDLTVYAGLPYGFEVGYIEYQFPTTIGDTRELYVTWSKEMILTPTIAFYYDFGTVNSAYTSLDLTYSAPFEGKLSLDISGLVALAGKGWAEAVGGTKGGFFNYNVSAALGYQATEVFGLQATGGYSGSLDTAVLPKQPLGGYILAGVSFAF